MTRIQSLTLIDDDDIFVYLTKKIIQQTKLVEMIHVFENGLEALNFLKENKNDHIKLPEIIFLDINMPIMNGWQFLREFSKLKPKINRKITIYVCSSSIAPDDMIKAKSISEVTDYIIKPVTKAKFINIIENL